MKPLSLLLTLLTAGTIWSHAGPLQEHAGRFQKQLKDQVMPYWLATLDLTNGGYALADSAQGRTHPREKSLVSQSRMVWGFAQAHLAGLSDDRHDYLRAAAHGRQFLLENFRDPEFGGYYWRLDPGGKVLLDRKLLYGQSFGIYALVEYYRASHDPTALKQALELFKLLRQKAYDRAHGGWLEHFTRNWQPILQPDENIEVEVAGCKSANTHLHLMEAFTELYDASHDADVKKALQEVVELNTKYFYPREVGKSSFHRHLDWQPVTDPQSAGLSYGHNVEFAWLLIRAQKVLDAPPDWAHFYAEIDHALKYGYDWKRGGLYARGLDDQPATDTDKVWWAEAELIAALSDALAHQPNPTYTKALDLQIRFLNEHQINPADGIWFDTVAADGRLKAGGKAHAWKANYHDVRAIVKFTETFNH